jgi:hypothetical protein
MSGPDRSEPIRAENRHGDIVTHPRQSWFVIGLVLAWFAIVGCSTSQEAVSPPPARSLALPTLATLPGACAGIGLDDARLAGDPNDPRIVWLSFNAAPGRHELVFRPGFSARFAPDLEVLNAAGIVVAKLGDPIGEACVTGSAGPNDPWLILWPDDSRDSRDPRTGTLWDPAL